MKRQWAACALILLCQARLAWGWGSTGHDALCRAAWDLASPQARALVADTLKINSAAELGRLCNWADHHVADLPWFKTHHYINVPRGQQLEPAANCGINGCVVRAVGQQARFFLASESSAEQKAIALKMLVHFLGDLHQPLHVSYGEDRGGNTIPVQFCPAEVCWGSLVDDLHKTWDRGILEAEAPLDAHGQHDVDAIATEIEHGISESDRNAWRTGDVGSWARETYALATTEAYRPWTNGKVQPGYIGDPPADRFDSAYVAHMRPIVLRQLRRAAVRLADVLDTLAQGDVPAQLTTLAPTQVTAADIIVHRVPLLKSPSAGASRVAALEKNDRAELIGPDDYLAPKWYRLRLADGTEGFAKVSYLRVLN